MRLIGQAIYAIAALVVAGLLGLIVACFMLKDWLYAGYRRMELTVLYDGDEAARAHEEWLNQ